MVETTMDLVMSCINSPDAFENATKIKLNMVVLPVADEYQARFYDENAELVYTLPLTLEKYNELRDQIINKIR